MAIENTFLYEIIVRTNKYSKRLKLTEFKKLQQNIFHSSSFNDFYNILFNCHNISEILDPQQCQKSKGRTQWTNFMSSIFINKKN